MTSNHDKEPGTGHHAEIGRPDAWADAVVVAARRLLRAAVEALSRGERPQFVEFATPAPFSRADAADYLRLVALWNTHGLPDLAGLAARDCPACGSADHRWLFESYDRYPFHGCRQCGTWFVPYAVDDSLTERFLAAVPEARRIADRMMAGRESHTKISDRERFFHYFDLLAPILKAKPGQIGYLDIGCGVGHSVELAKELGFDATGVEINETALATARAKGRNVHHPARWQARATFDLVSLFETLEHITNPDAVIEQAGAQLATNGALILTVPNAASSELSLLRERCFHVFGGFEGVGHINLFTPEGLRRLLRRHGFELIHLDGQFGINPLDVAAWLLDPHRPALDHFIGGATQTRLPRVLHHVLNSIGPDLAVLDRALLRSPILIAVACRAPDQANLRPLIEQMAARRAKSIRDSLPPSEPDRSVPEPGPLFAGGAAPIDGFMAPDTARLLGARGLTPSVASGLSLRSVAPLSFERMATLGSGRLAAGSYELAVQALARTGRVSFSLFDEGRQAWAATVGLEPHDTEVRTEFELAADTDCTLYVCAHNSDAPGPVDVEIFDAGLAARGGRARLIPPPPEPDRSVPESAPLFAVGSLPIDGFIEPEHARVLAAPGLTASVAAGLSLRSAAPLRFERMARLGTGRLAAGDYELAAQALARTGRVSFSLFDEVQQSWAASLALEPGEREVRGTFSLATETECTLFVCAHNSDAPGPVDVEIFDVGLAARGPGSRLILPLPEPDRSVPEPVPLFSAGAVPIDGFIAPEHARLLSAPGFTASVAKGLSLRSAAPLGFERIVSLGRGRLAAGSYELAAQALARTGRVSFSLLDEARGAWVASLALEPGEREVRGAYLLAADTDCTLYVCAHNSDAPGPVDVEIFDAGLAARDGRARLIPPPPEPDRSVPEPGPLFAPGSAPVDGFITPEHARLLAAPGLTASVAKGLSLRSAAPLSFERMAIFGSGRLAAGSYELAAQALARTGRVSFSLLDEARQTWAASLGLEPGEREVRGAFSLAADTDCTLYVCAHNSDAPGPVDVEVFDVGLAARDGRARLIPPLPQPNRFEPEPGPLFATGSVPVDGFITPAHARLLAAPGVTASVAKGLSLRSAEPLSFERMATLGSGRLAAGTYELAAQALARTGRVSFSILEEGRQAWAASLGLEPGEREVRGKFSLAAETDCTLYVCAHNSDAPGPVDVEIFDVGLAARDGRARLIPPPPEPDRSVPPLAPLFDAAGPLRPIDGYLIEQHARVFGATAFARSVAHGLAFRSAQPLQFERMAALGRGRLAAGRYELAAHATARSGRVSFGLFDDSRQVWAAATNLEPGSSGIRTSFALDHDTDTTLYLCANNSEDPRPVHVEIQALGLAAASGTAGLVLSPEPAGRAATRVTHLFDARLKPLLEGALAGAGLALRSPRPVAGEEMIRLGSGLLPAGHYLIEAEALVLQGAIAIAAVLPNGGGDLARIALSGIRRSGSMPFELAAPAEIALVATGANTAGPAATEAMLRRVRLSLTDDPASLNDFLARRASRADLVQLLTAPAYRDPRLAGMAAAFIRLDQAASEYLLVGPMRRLAAGHYELVADIECSEGRIAVGMIGEGERGWLAQMAFDAAGRSGSTVMRLDDPQHGALVISAANANPGPISALVHGLALAHLDGRAGGPPGGAS